MEDKQYICLKLLDTIEFWTECKVIMIHYNLYTLHGYHKPGRALSVHMYL